MYDDVGSIVLMFVLFVVVVSFGFVIGIGVVNNWVFVVDVIFDDVGIVYVWIYLCLVDYFESGVYFNLFIDCILN